MTSTRTQARRQRGATLIEAMIAMGVLMLGAAGAAGMQRQSMYFMADSRQATRAGAFAQDLASQVELWEYDDPRLVNTDPDEMIMHRATLRAMLDGTYWDRLPS